MPGSIDLNSVIAMMNQAAESSQRGASIKAVDHKGTPLKVSARFSAGKKAWDEATTPKQKPAPATGTPLTSNMLMVDPVAQAIVMQDLDASQQNYLMQAFNTVNGRT